jgi:hypothetical protein
LSGRGVLAGAPSSDQFVLAIHSQERKEIHHAHFTNLGIRRAGSLGVHDARSNGTGSPSSRVDYPNFRVYGRRRHSG